MSASQVIRNSVSPGLLDEAPLVARLRAGDEHAFEQVVRAYAAPLYATAQRLLRNEQDSADAVQEALLHAVRSIGTFRGDSLLLTWLKRIVMNAALMRLRERTRRPARSIDDLLPRFADDGHRMELRDTWQEPAETLLARRDVRDAVRRNIQSLPDDYRAVLLLRDVEGLDTAQTARLIGISPGAVKVRLHRARMALRELMERDLVAMSG